VPTSTFTTCVILFHHVNSENYSQTVFLFREVTATFNNVFGNLHCG